jgi:anaerobic selenocysteine-containing dehydrogenase
MDTVRVVCGHDCLDMCSLLASVEDGQVRRIAGDPKQPFTAGFACAKINRDAELVHSPECLTTPLKRCGPRAGAISKAWAGNRCSTKSRLVAGHHIQAWPLDISRWSDRAS